MDFSQDSNPSFNTNGPGFGNNDQSSGWNNGPQAQNSRGRGRGRGGWHQNNNNHYNNQQQQQNQQWAPPQQNQQPPPSWAPPQNQGYQNNAPQGGNSGSPPKIFVRADGCDAFLDLRVILPSDRFPNINWGGRIIGSKGATIKMLQQDHNCKVLINDGNNGKDPSYDPNTDPPHVRVQASGPLGDVLRRMATVADELSTRFDPYWKDPMLQKVNEEKGNDKEEEATPEAAGDDAKNEPEDQESESQSPNKQSRGGFRGGRGGRGQFNNRGRGGNFRGGRGDFRGGFNNRGGRGGMRGGFNNQGGNNFQQGGPMRRGGYQQSYTPY